jgi:hypothetical protein
MILYCDVRSSIRFSIHLYLHKMSMKANLTINISEKYGGVHSKSDWSMSATIESYLCLFAYILS